MAPRGAILLLSSVVLVLLRLVVGQLETMDNEKGTTKSACPPSTPFYITVGGVQKCSAASKQSVDKLTIGVTVSVALSLLLLVVGYVYRKMRREHHSSISSSSSNSSSRLKRKRQRCPSPSSPKTFILAEDVSSPANAIAREVLAGDKEACELKEEPRTKPHCRHHGLCLRGSSAQPRHGPRYIKQLAATSFKQTSGLSTVQEDDCSFSHGNEQVEMCLCSTPGAEKADEDSSGKLLPPQKRRRLGSPARRKTGRDIDLERRIARCFLE